MKILSGHTSPETAYVVDDYPYGFRLRCKIRYWLEDVPKKGTRLCSQTTNPKVAGEVWNKPKKSTFAYVAGVMIQDESNGHIGWTTLSEYSDFASSTAWYEKYREGLSEQSTKRVVAWIKAKEIYEAAKAAKEAGK